MSRLVVIGNSAAGLAAIEAIRSRDRRSKLTLVAAETHLPYSRILLTYLLSGKTTLADVPVHGPEWYRRMDVEPLTGRRALSIDTRRGVVITEHAGSGKRAERVAFDELLIATGATAQLPEVPGVDLPGVFCLRDLDDATAIQEHLAERLPASRRPRAVFLGAGPVCLQSMTALAARGMQVRLMVRSPAILSQLADPDTAAMAERVLRAHGIVITKGVDVTGIEPGASTGRAPSLLAVVTAEGRRVPADLIIVGKGTTPNAGLARSSGIAADYGITVDDNLMTSAPGVYAAGDVAQASHCVSGEKVCYGTWTNACEQGRIAGLNMTGTAALWNGGLNRNVTTLFGNTIGSVGMIRERDVSRSGADVRVVRHRDRRSGTSRRILFSAGRCVGAVAWNACDDLGVIGWLINSGRDCTGQEERMARGQRVYADALGAKLARTPANLGHVVPAR